MLSFKNTSWKFFLHFLILCLIKFRDIMLIYLDSRLLDFRISTIKVKCDWSSVFFLHRL
ncbi:unnamed protein product, partial [Vitis vinifera]